MYTIITVTFNADGGKLYDYLLLNPNHKKLDRGKPLLDQSNCPMFYVGYNQEEAIPTHVTKTIILKDNNYVTIGSIPTPKVSPASSSLQEYERMLEDGTKDKVLLDEGQFINDSLIVEEDMGALGYRVIHYDIYPKEGVRKRMDLFYNEHKNVLMKKFVSFYKRSIDKFRPLSKSSAKIIKDLGHSGLL